MQSESVAQLAPDLIRLRANNPSPMTFTGTNTYILGKRELVVIDPGPNQPEHLRAILSTLPSGGRLTTILVTHSHLDHSPLARPLAAETGARILAAGPSDFGRSPVMARLAETGTLGGGEGVDTGFAPDDRLRDGDHLIGPFGAIDVIATPGHMANHLSFAWQGALFSGDLVMGWSTSLISPPDGDMSAFFASLATLQNRQDQIYYPGHGEPVKSPKARLTELIAHRRSREHQILSTLARLEHATARMLTQAIYTETPRDLLPAAERNVLAHLIDLEAKSQVICDGVIQPDTLFTRP